MSDSAKRKKGLLALHTASLLFGGTALFSKLIDLPALDITVVRSVFAVLALFGLLLWRKSAFLLKSKSHFWLMVLAGVLIGLHWVTYFHAMQVSSVAVGMIALFTHPMMTIFLEPLFKRERPELVDIACGLLVFVGIFLMVPELSFGNDVALGVFWGVCSAFFFSLRNVIQGHYLSHYGGELSMLYQGAVVVLLLMPFLGSVPTLGWQPWLMLVVLGVCFTALPHVLFATSFKYLKTKTASLIACLQPVYGACFAAVLLGEYPTLATIIGGVIIVTASAWESYRSR